jgi:putative ABC transport system permease protein
MRILSELAGDVRYALRTWRRHPSFVIIAVLSLSAGIGLNTTVFSIINTIFLQSIRGVADPARVVTMGGRVSYPAFRAVRDSAATVDGVAVWQPLGVVIRVRDTMLRRTAPAVSAAYFEVLGVSPARGRFFDTRAAGDPAPLNEVVLDFEFWRDTLGSDPGVLGGTVVLNDVPATIVGVAPRSFHGFGPERPPLWMSISMAPAVASAAPGWDAVQAQTWRMFGRLRPGMTPGSVNAELAAIAARAPAVFEGQPPRASSGGEGWAGAASGEKRIEFLLVVVVPLVVVALILWVGCSNVANLLLARAAARRKEIAIRLANGASRLRLLRLLLTESLLLALTGGLVGVMLAIWTRDLVWAALPEAPRLAVELDATVMIYTAVICVLATLLFGLVPALHATNVDVAPLLKGDESATRHARAGSRVRTFFLVTQFASSTALLIVAGTFVRSVVETHLGEQAAFMDHLALASVESRQSSAAAREAYWRQLREAVHRVPGVQAVTLTPAGQSSARIAAEGAAGADRHTAIALQQIDGGFLRTAGISLSAGSDPIGVPGGRPADVLVNARAARQLRPGGDIVGARYVLDGSRSITVAGVVDDRGSEAKIYERLEESGLKNANVLIRTSGSSDNAVGALRSAILPLAPDRAMVRVATLREASTGMLQRLTTMAVTIALVVLSLATVGLYGSVAFLTTQRTREIAIRIAIGAPRRAVLRLLATQGLVIVAFGSAAGLIATGFAFRFMSGMIFARWSLDPLTVGAVLIAFAATTLAACYVPGRRALRVDPMRVLRN